MQAVCEKCLNRFNAPDEYAGRNVTCPRCSEFVSLPSVTALQPQRVVITGIQLSLDNMGKLIAIFVCAMLLLAAIVIGGLLVVANILRAFRGE